jgi:hypothetical protein
VRSLSFGKALLLAVSIDAVLFAGAGLVGNNRPGWRGPLGDVFWVGALLGILAVALLILFAGVRAARRRVPA